MHSSLFTLLFLSHLTYCVCNTWVDFRTTSHRTLLAQSLNSLQHILLFPLVRCDVSITQEIPTFSGNSFPSPKAFGATENMPSKLLLVQGLFLIQMWTWAWCYSGKWILTLGAKSVFTVWLILTSWCLFPTGLSGQPFSLLLSVPSFSTLPLSWVCLYHDDFE